MSEGMLTTHGITDREGEYVAVDWMLQGLLSGSLPHSLLSPVLLGENVAVLTPCPPVYVPVHNTTSCVMSAAKHAFMLVLKPITTAAAYMCICGHYWVPQLVPQLGMCRNGATAGRMQISAYLPRLLHVYTKEDTHTCSCTHVYAYAGSHYA